MRHSFGCCTITAFSSKASPFTSGPFVVPKKPNIWRLPSSSLSFSVSTRVSPCSMILGRRWFRQEDTLQATHGFVRRLFASLVMPLHLTTTPVSSRSHHTSTSSAKRWPLSPNPVLATRRWVPLLFSRKRLVAVSASCGGHQNAVVVPPLSSSSVRRQVSRSSSLPCTPERGCWTGHLTRRSSRQSVQSIRARSTAASSRWLQAAHLHRGEAGGAEGRRDRTACVAANGWLPLRPITRPMHEASQAQMPVSELPSLRWSSRWDSLLPFRRSPGTRRACGGRLQCVDEGESFLRFAPRRLQCSLFFPSIWLRPNAFILCFSSPAPAAFGWNRKKKSQTQSCQWLRCARYYMYSGLHLTLGSAIAESVTNYCKIRNFRPIPVFVLLTWNWFVRTNFRTFEGVKARLHSNSRASNQKEIFIQYKI